MAFESIVAYVILFSLGMSAVVGLAVFYKDYVVKTSTSLDSRQDILNSKDQSDIDILSATYTSPQNIIKEITSQFDFETGILENINQTIYSGSLILDNETVSNYYSQGNWTSPIYDFGIFSNFSRIYFSGITPVDTWVGIQIRSAENTTELIGDFIGPDGTKDSYYESSGQLLNSIHKNHQVMQLKLYLNTSDAAFTPMIDEINISYEFSYDMLSLSILNTGKVKLNKNIIDIFVNNTRIPRNQAGLSSEVISSTELQNPGLWDPSEELNVSFPIGLSNGKYVARVTNEFSTEDYLVFEI